MKELEMSTLMNKIGEIANNYSLTAEEYATLKIAAKALFFIECNKQVTEFSTFLDFTNRELDEDEKAFLEKLGL